MGEMRTSGGTRPAAAAVTDVGRQRKHNEDHVLVRPEFGLFVVADGMGGHAAGEVACNATDVAVHTHGGNGLSVEYGLGTMLLAARLGRIAPVSREMILNFVAQHSLGLPRSY